MKCRICFEEHADVPTVTPCGHIFCNTHILEWMKQESTCPVCRRHIQPKLLVKVYDGKDEPDEKSGKVNFTKKDGESDSVQKMLRNLQSGWDESIMIRAKLNARVKKLEHENEELKKQLEAALIEIDTQKKQATMRKRQDDIEVASDEEGYYGNERDGHGRQSSRHDDEPRADGGEGRKRNDRSGAGSKFDDDAEDEDASRQVESSALYDQSIPSEVENKLLSRFKLWKTYELHNDPVHGVDVHPTKPLVASASWDKSCIIYDIERDTVLTKLQGHHKKGLYAAKFSKEHQNLVGTVSSDNTCRLWRLDTGKQIAKLSGHEDEVNGMAFHQNSLATASDDRTIMIWDIETYQAVAKLEGHRNSVYGLCYQPAGHTNGGLLASVAFDWMTLIWDPRESTRTPVRKLEGHRDDIIGVDFAPNGIALATGSDDGTCRVWDCRMWRSTAILADHQGECKRVSFSPYGRALATTSGDGTAKVWDMYTFDCTDTLEGHEDHVFDAAWGQDGNFLITGCHDNKWRLWKPDI